MQGYVTRIFPPLAAVLTAYPSFRFWSAGLHGWYDSPVTPLSVQLASRAARRDLLDVLLLDILQTGVYLGGI
jgi:hypothetical protein